MKRPFSLFFFVLFSSALIAQEKFLDPEERIYGLSQIWKEMHYSFAFPETLEKVNIDSLYKAYLPKVEQADSRYKYYKELCAFMAHFNEAHTRIHTSKRPDDTLPIETMNFGKRVVVSNVIESLADKIPVGSEIIRVDQMAVVDYIQENVYPYIAAATPHWKFDKAVTEMFYGEPNSLVHLVIKTPNGEERELNVMRNYHSTTVQEVMVSSVSVSPINISIINKNIGYIKFSSCMQQYLDTICTVFNNHLPQLRECTGLIVDIRGNRGGTDEAWENLMFHLLSGKQFQTKGKWSTRLHVGNSKYVGSYDEKYKDFYTGMSMLDLNYPPYTNTVEEVMKLSQPLIIISGQYVGSAAEDFLLLIKENERATIIGGPTVGCVGVPVFLPLPGDLNVMICVNKYINQDGTQPNHTGILPDIEMENSYEDYLQGKDKVLERAILELCKN